MTTTTTTYTSYHLYDSFDVPNSVQFSSAPELSTQNDLRTLNLDDQYYRHLTVLFVSSNDVITPLIDSLRLEMTIYTSRLFLHFSTLTLIFS